MPIRCDPYFGKIVLGDAYCSSTRPTALGEIVTRDSVDVHDLKKRVLIYPLSMSLKTGLTDIYQTTETFLVHNF